MLLLTHILFCHVIIVVFVIVIVTDGQCAADNNAHGSPPRSAIDIVCFKIMLITVYTVLPSRMVRARRVDTIASFTESGDIEESRKRAVETVRGAVKAPGKPGQVNDIFLTWLSFQLS